MKKTKDLLGKGLKAMDAAWKEYEKEPGWITFSDLKIFHTARELMEKHHTKKMAA